MLRVTSTAICDSDLHMFDGLIPGTRKGDIIGHEFMGIVEDVGPKAAASGLSKGDRGVVPFTVTCGSCLWCERQEYSLCDESNRDAKTLAAMNVQASAGLFGHSHLSGGYDGGQAEYLRLPFADATHMRVPDGLSDE